MGLVTIGLQILFILFFSFTGAIKLFAHHHMIEEFDKFGYPHWLMRLAGILEIVAAALLIAGFSHPIYGALGAIILSCVMIGACYTNFTQRPAAFGWGTLVLVLLCAWLATHYGMLAEVNYWPLS